MIWVSYITGRAPSKLSDVYRFWSNICFHSGNAFSSENLLHFNKTILNLILPILQHSGSAVEESRSLTDLPGLVTHLKHLMHHKTKNMYFKQLLHWATIWQKEQHNDVSCCFYIIFNINYFICVVVSFWNGQIHFYQSKIMIYFLLYFFFIYFSYFVSLKYSSFFFSFLFSRCAPLRKRYLW